MPTYTTSQEKTSGTPHRTVRPDNHQSIYQLKDERPESEALSFLSQQAAQSEQAEHLRGMQLMANSFGGVNTSVLQKRTLIDGNHDLEKETAAIAYRPSDKESDPDRIAPGGVGDTPLQRKEVIQMVRAKLGPVTTPINIVSLQQAIGAIDTEIAELPEECPEVKMGFIEMDRIRHFRKLYNDHMAALLALNPGNAGFTVEEIMAQGTDVLKAFRKVVVQVSNLRGTLNKSYQDYDDYVKGKEAEQRLQDEIASFGEKKPEPQKQDKDSKYKAQVDKYDAELGGAVVLVDDHFVVVVEHYQLKHNPDLGILQAGGPFKGKKGSQLEGGWNAHRTTYAVQILAAAKAAIAGYKGEVDDSTNITLAKVRLANIEAYIGITRDGPDWVIHYHGNPPG